jgi:hypothetical protein
MEVKVKRLFRIIFFLIPVLLFTKISLGSLEYEFIKVERIAILSPINIPAKKERSKKIIGGYFERYALARSQVSLLLANQIYDYNSVQTVLKDLRKQNYDLAVIPFIQGQNFGIYELKQNRKLWVLSGNLESDLELLFWIIDRSLIAGIKIVPKNVHIGLTPGKNGDLGLYFPCSKIYYNLKQLPHLKITAISKKKYDVNYHQLNEFSKKQKVDYFLYYESNELNRSMPLITGSILDPNGYAYGDIKMRIASKTNLKVSINPHKDRNNWPPNPEFRRDIEGEQYQSVSSNNFGNVANELSHYLLSVLLTEFCFPQQPPLKLKLTNNRKYIREGKHSFPELDNTILPENVIRF